MTPLIWRRKCSSSSIVILREQKAVDKAVEANKKEQREIGKLKEQVEKLKA